MKLIGYSKFKSKTTGKDLCILHLIDTVSPGYGRGYRPFTRRGNQPVWCSPSIQIDDSMIMKDVELIYESNEFAEPVVSGVRVVK